MSLTHGVYFDDESWVK